jgi:hypothetical protein
MAQAAAPVDPLPQATQAEGDEKQREMSSIAFPYQSLNEGIEIAKAVHELHGSTATNDQIAAHLDSTPTSGTYRTKVSTAKVFGLITTSQGSVTLTPLGSRICDKQQEAAARVEAFLTVPLYSKVYEQFQGGVLPPTNSGLEATLGSHGVAVKQRERARQILLKSAQEAGFFQFGKERLVKPAIRASAAAPVIAPEQEPEPEKKKKAKDDDEDDLHPFIKGLLTKLPKPDEEWAQEGRAKWLETAANIFDLLYKNSDDNNRVISIRVEKDSAR